MKRILGPIEEVFGPKDWDRINFNLFILCITQVNLTVVPDTNSETTLRFINTATNCPVVVYPNPELKIEQETILDVGEVIWQPMFSL